LIKTDDELIILRSNRNSISLEHRQQRLHCDERVEGARILTERSVLTIMKESSKYVTQNKRVKVQPPGVPSPLGLAAA